MTSHRPVQSDKSMLQKWFGPNRNTHWAVAGAVGVIMLGSYLVYSNRDSNPATIAVISATERTPAPIAPAPLTSEKVK
jgi:hypothetical protein